MAVVKRINDNYSLTALNSNVDITGLTVTINGNLIVVGTTTTVESVDTLVYDNFITLNAGQPGGPGLNAGITIDRGPSNNAVGIRWHEDGAVWQYTDDGIVWNTFSGTVVEQDKNPHLGGNLIVGNYAITNDSGNVVIGPVIQLEQIGTDPDNRPGYSSLYAKETQSGNTGFFVSNEKTKGEELITKRKALVYSLIL